MWLKNKNIKLVVLLGLLIVLIGTTGCKYNNYKGSSNKQEVLLSAAASLTESLKEIKKNYEKKNTNTDVQLNLGGSSKLRTQIEQGSKTDIFLSANKKEYDILKDKGLIHEGKHLLSNSIVLVVSKNNPAKINSLQDLTNKNKLILAEKEVPIGNYTLKVLDKLNKKYGSNYKEKVLSNVVSKELDVKKVLSKVVLGEGDAAFVYFSDITSNIKDKVKVVEIPKEYNVKAEYWIGILKSSKDKKKVQDLYKELLSEESKNIFQKYSFEVLK